MAPRHSFSADLGKKNVALPVDVHRLQMVDRLRACRALWIGSRSDGGRKR